MHMYWLVKECHRFVGHKPELPVGSITTACNNYIIQSIMGNITHSDCRRIPPSLGKFAQ